ncbi:hypothetical protein HK102_004682 [Quaeritorhiza haematococci]|nr:hypothetical protein HK102_004682 [Quaeritorhiza haematococci]
MTATTRAIASALTLFLLAVLSLISNRFQTHAIPLVVSPEASSNSLQNEVDVDSPTLYARDANTPALKVTITQSLFDELEPVVENLLTENFRLLYVDDMDFTLPVPLIGDVGFRVENFKVLNFSLDQMTTGAKIQDGYIDFKLEGLAFQVSSDFKAVAGGSRPARLPASNTTTKAVVPEVEGGVAAKQVASEPEEVWSDAEEAPVPIMDLDKRDWWNPWSWFRRDGQEVSPPPSNTPTSGEGNVHIDIVTSITGKLVIHNNGKGALRTSMQDLKSTFSHFDVKVPRRLLQWIVSALNKVFGGLNQVSLGLGLDGYGATMHTVFIGDPVITAERGIDVGIGLVVQQR